MPQHRCSSLPATDGGRHGRHSLFEESSLEITAASGAEADAAAAAPTSPPKKEAYSAAPDAEIHTYHSKLPCSVQSLAACSAAAAHSRPESEYESERASVRRGELRSNGRLASRSRADAHAVRASLLSPTACH